MTNSWQHFEHKADIGVRGIGNSKQLAFAQAALAMTAVIADLKTIEQKEKIKITCEYCDDETALTDWLNALIYEMAVRKMLFSRFEIQFKDNLLIAEAFGETLDSKKHQPAVEVKAATYHCLKVEKNSDGSWLAQCVVDV